MAAWPTTISNTTPTLDKEAEKGNKPSSFSILSAAWGCKYHNSMKL